MCLRIGRIQIDAILYYLKALLYMHSNLYVDVAVLKWVLPKQECYNHIKSLVDAEFGDRIMYGSDKRPGPG
mgnify:CR=1 FL=1